MKFSLVISTRGRTLELARLFRSFADQTVQDFEVIISDQNDDDRLLAIVEKSGLKDKCIIVKSSGGASRGRNQGMRKASGEFLTFPDDDCAYPPMLLEQVDEFFKNNLEYGYLSCRAFGDDGKDSVSHYSKHASRISKMRIHAQCVEFGLFFRRLQLSGLTFDEQMGVGAPTPWHSDEGPDLMLRLEEIGVHGYYDPRYLIWHPQPVTCYDAKAIDRTYRYACGNGYFYKKHRYPSWFFGYQLARTFCGFALALIMLKFGKSRLYLARLRGRWRGWSSHPYACSTGLPGDAVPSMVSSPPKADVHA